MCSGASPHLQLYVMMLEHVTRPKGLKVLLLDMGFGLLVSFIYMISSGMLNNIGISKLPSCHLTITFIKLLLKLLFNW